jgi:hypothetical protein
MIVAEFMLSHWRDVLIGVLICAVWGLSHLWRSEVEDFEAYRVKVAALGIAAEQEAQRVNELHHKTLEDTNNAWKSELPKARSGAVAAYLAAHPRSQLPRPCGGEVRGHADSPASTDGAGQECVPPEGFIADAAEDALKIGKWQAWAIDNKLETK